MLTLLPTLTTPTHHLFFHPPKTRNKDLDNLNLTFLATRAAHAKEINSRVVAEALRDRYGLPVSVNDRNDLTLYDKKISGSAYKLGNKTAFHHCTLLVASDLDALGGTLRPTTSGISTKGIASVRSHVTNLNSHVPEGTSIQTDELDAAIAAAFLTEFGKRTGNTSGVGCSGSEGAGVPILDIATDGWAGTKDGEMAARRKEVQSWGWLFGQGPAFSFEQAKAFEWGLATIRLKMKRGHVIEAELIVTPGEHNLANVAEKLFGAAMLGSKFGQYSIINAVNQLVPTDPQANEAAAGVRADLIGWVKESLPVLLRVEEEETP